MVPSIVIMSPPQFHEGIIQILRQHNPQGHFIPVKELVDLALLDEEMLKNSRLISFLNEYIVPPLLLNTFQYGAFNFHPGPPSYPGHAPFSFALYDQMKMHGTTVHEMLTKVDAGRIIATDYFPIPDSCYQQELIDLCINNAAHLLKKLASELVLKREPEFTSSAWGHHKTSKSMFANMCELNESMTSQEVERRLRAFGDGDGHCAPYFVQDNKRYQYWRALEDTPSADGKCLHGKYFKLVS
jgi:methionyl-tRNA formyltransferase